MNVATSEAGARNAGQVSASTYSRTDLNRLARQTARGRGYARHTWSLRIHPYGISLVIDCGAECFHVAL